jgi:hypothetical protein
MRWHISKVQVWSAEIPDRPGAAAGKLERLARSGIDLEFIFTRPHPRNPEMGILFVAPIEGPEKSQEAREVGFAPASDMAMLAVSGDNRAGIGYELMSQLALAGINLPGLSISALGNRFVAYLAFENPDTATLALRLLANLAD